MKLPLFAARPGNSRRRSGRRVLDVESMESRALLTLSPTVMTAILSVDQAYLNGHDATAQEVSTLKSNIQGIQDATREFIVAANSDIITQKMAEISDPTTVAADKAAIKADQASIKLAIRDEKFAIGQQNAAIKAVGKVDKSVTSSASAEIKGLKKGTIDPANVSTDIMNASTVVTNQLTAIDNTATLQFNELTAVFNNGTP